MVFIQSSSKVVTQSSFLFNQLLQTLHCIKAYSLLNKQILHFISTLQCTQGRTQHLREGQFLVQETLLLIQPISLYLQKFDGLELKANHHEFPSNARLLKSEN